MQAVSGQLLGSTRLYLSGGERNPSATEKYNVGISEKSFSFLSGLDRSYLILYGKNLHDDRTCIIDLIKDDTCVLSSVTAGQ